MNTADKSALNLDLEELQILHRLKTKNKEIFNKNSGNNRTKILKINYTQYNRPWLYGNQCSKKNVKQSSCSDYVLDIQKSLTSTSSLKITNH